MPFIDYTPLVSAHWNADESVATAALLAEVGLDIPRPGGTVAVIADGALNGARGPCSGSHAGGGAGFYRTISGGDILDTRQVAGSFTAGTMMGWGRLQAGHGATQEYASQARLAAASNTKAWIFRGVQDFGGGLEGPVMLLWSSISSTFVLSTGFNWTTPIPHNEWYFLGWAVDLINDFFIGYIRVPSIGDSSIIISLLPANVFTHTVVDQNWMFGIDSGHSSGGQGFELDNITWMKNYAVPTLQRIARSLPG